MTVPAEEGPANSVPAAAVIRRVQALSGFIGFKGSVGGPLSQRRKPAAQPRNCLRSSASVPAQSAAFAAGVPPDICAFHRYTRNSTLLYRTLVTAVSGGVPGLSPGFSHPTYRTAYELFTPNNSGQRLVPTYYRGCWHVVGRTFFCRYRHFRPC